jgi:hypothetical protein
MTHKGVVGRQRVNKDYTEMHGKRNIKYGKLLLVTSISAQKYQNFNDRQPAHYVGDISDQA